MPVSFKVTGGKEMAQTLKAASVEHKRKVRAALYVWTELLVTNIKDNYVPVRDGILKSSVKATLPQEEDGVIFVIIYAGDASSPSAIAVHEHLSEHSPESWKVKEANGRHVVFHPAGRGPKFVQTPLLIESSSLAEFIAKELQI